MKSTLTILALAFSFLALSPAPAQAAKGQLIAASRCLCEASMLVTIDGVRGHIRDGQKVDAVIVMANDIAIRIDNPANGIRHYYVVYDVAKDAEMSAALLANGIDPSRVERVTLRAFEAAADTPLFRDSEAKNRIN